jgi:hypothetical protein
MSISVKDGSGNPQTVETLPVKGQATASASLPVTIASDDILVGKIGEVQTTPTVNTLLGRLKDLTTNIVLAAGGNLLGKVGIDQTTNGTTNAVVIKDSGGSVIDWTLSSPIIGPTAAGAALTVAPVTEGGLAKTALPTAVSDGNVVNAMFDKFGRQIVKGALRELKGKQTTTLTATTTETTIVTAGAAAVFRDIYLLTITNTSAVDTTATLREATAGSTVAVYQVPAGATVGFSLTDSSALTQTTGANNWTIQLGTSVSSVFILAAYVETK